MAGGGIVPPMTLMALPFHVAPLRVMVCFPGAFGVVEDAFKEDF